MSSMFMPSGCCGASVISWEKSTAAWPPPHTTFILEPGRRQVCAQRKAEHKKVKRRPLLAAFFGLLLVKRLDSLDVLRLPALGAFDHVKLHLLTFLQAAEAAGLNGGEMDENILAILAADESVSFSVVKPLHCSCFHDGALFLFVDVALKSFRIFCRQVTRWVERRYFTAEKLKDQTHFHCTKSVCQMLHNSRMILPKQLKRRMLWDYCWWVG